MEIIPELVVKDMQSSIKFYKELFAFNIDYQDPIDNPIWCQLSNGTATMMLQDISSILKELEGNFPKEIVSTSFLMIRIDKNDYEKIEKYILENNIKIFKEKTLMGYGSIEMGIYDPDGYRIVISGN